MRHLGPVHWNLQMPFLYEHAVRQRQGEIGLELRAVFRLHPVSAAFSGLADAHAPAVV